MTDRRDDLATAIRERIVSSVHLGTLSPGSRLPSTRELAREFKVAPRTVMAAYRLLEAEGVVSLRQRSGIYVAAGSGSGSAAKLTQLSSWVVDTLLEARSREVPPVHFPERVRRCLQTLRLHAVCISDNADQLDQVCCELTEDYGIESTGVLAGQLNQWTPEVAEAMRRADLLVSTARYATRVQSLGREHGKPVFVVRLRKELMGELARLLEQGPVYIVGSDPCFREAVRVAFESLPGGENARAIILGEDDLAAIPAEAPTYIMRRAHAQLEDGPFARRVVPVRRVFAAEMARELLTFVVRANMSAEGRLPGSI